MNIIAISATYSFETNSTHNVFGIQVGVSINLFVKLSQADGGPRIFYSHVDEFWRKEDKFSFLESTKACSRVEWQEIMPSQSHAWLTEGLSKDFEEMLPVGTRESKAGLGHAVFTLYSLGVATNRDAWAYSFSDEALKSNIKRTIDFYNSQVLEWANLVDNPKVDDFVANDDSKISWTGGLKELLQRGVSLKYDNTHIRQAEYRPFAKTFVYFDSCLNQRRYQMHRILPTVATQYENRLICLTGRGFEKPFSVLMTSTFVDISFFGFGRAAQCFPYYAYDEDGGNRRENVTDWAVDQVSGAVGKQVDKWQIFHYVYGLLHSPVVQEELPCQPKPGASTNTAAQDH